MRATGLKLCVDCIRVRDNPLPFPLPRHVVHPEHGKPGVRSVHCEVLCVECGAVWRHGGGNAASIVS
jgi:hypothetical protein